MRLGAEALLELAFGTELGGSDKCLVGVLPPDLDAGTVVGMFTIENTTFVADRGNGAA